MGDDLEDTAAPYDARAVANFVLDEADRLEVKFTQLQLYKIIYFAHGWYLATEGRRLIKQNFQAWNHGPVVRVLRDAFKHFGRSYITDRAERLDIFTGELVAIDQITSFSDREFLSKVVGFYHAFDGWALSEMTHEQDSPWDRVWNSKVPVGNLGLQISDTSIREHFERLSDKFSMN